MNGAAVGAHKIDHPGFVGNSLRRECNRPGVGRKARGHGLGESVLILDGCGVEARISGQREGLVPMGSADRGDQRLPSTEEDKPGPVVRIAVRRHCGFQHLQFHRLQRK